MIECKRRQLARTHLMSRNERLRKYCMNPCAKGAACLPPFLRRLTSCSLGETRVARRGVAIESRGEGSEREFSHFAPLFAEKQRLRLACRETDTFPHQQPCTLVPLLQSPSLARAFAFLFKISSQAST